MINTIILSVCVILGIFLGDYLCSLIFSSVSKMKNFLFETILFLVFMNLFLFNILVSDNLLIQAFVYLLVSFVSIIASKSIVFLLLNNVLIHLMFKPKAFNSKSINLAIKLNKKLDKDEVIDYFKSSGFSSSFINHLRKVLKD